MSAEDKSKKLTVFRSDRHEDVGACVFAALATACVLIYMAFFLDKVVIKAPVDGKLTEMKVAVGETIKQGQAIYTYETVKKKYVEGKIQESKATETFKSKVPGKVVELQKKPGDAFKRGNALLTVEHEKGTLP